MIVLHLPQQTGLYGVLGASLRAVFLILLAAYSITDTFGQANNAPVASNISASVSVANAWNTWQEITPLVGTDAEGEALSYRIVSLPKLGDGSEGGYLSLGSQGNALALTAGQVVTAPLLHFKASSKSTGIVATFSYTAIDSKGNESAVPGVYTVYIGLTPVPSAVSKIAPAIPNLGGRAEVALESKGGTVVAYRIIRQPDPAQGKLTLSVAGVPLDLPITLGGFVDLSVAQAVQLVFTPNPSFTGIASFAYVAGDAIVNLRTVGTGGRNARYSAPATYSIPVYAPGPLPVELTGFSATAGKAGVTLHWGTASEKDNDYFQVERSADGKNFAAIGQVKGGGASSVAQAYTFVDENALGIHSYYRLKQVDFGGHAEYSKVVAVKVASPTSVSLEAYPNPTQGKITLDLDGFLSGPVTVTLFQGSGRVVYRGKVEQGQPLTLNLSEQVPGMYYAQVQTATGKIAVKVVRQ